MAQKKFQELHLKDAFLFGAVMEDAEICRLTLQVLLSRRVDKVTVHVEHTLLYHSDSRGIRLDVYAVDESGTNYNVEMQNRNYGNLPWRSRYHQAGMDMTSFPQGTDFRELKPNYVIFICTFDPFGEGLYRYTFENRCRERDIPLGDEAVRIFLNTKGKNDSEVPMELVHFLRYVEESTPECARSLQDATVDRLQAKIADLKRSRSWEGRYMTIEEWVEEELAEGMQIARSEGLRKGREEGRQEGLQEGLQEGRQEGLQEGRKEGLQEGQDRLLKLMNQMLEAGEGGELRRLSTEPAFLQEMYQKYHL